MITELFSLFIVLFFMIATIVIIVQLGYIVGGINRLVEHKNEERFRRKQEQLQKEKEEDRL